MRHDFAVEARVFDFRQGNKRAKFGQSGGTADRLSPGASIVVIAVLSAFSWAILIALIVAVHSLL